MENTQTNLLRLKEHIDKQIESNIRNGWANRNEMPVLVRLNRTTPKGKMRSRFFNMQGFWVGQMGVGSKNFGVVVIASEADEIGKGKY